MMDASVADFFFLESDESVEIAGSWDAMMFAFDNRDNTGTAITQLTSRYRKSLFFLGFCVFFTSINLL